MKQIWTNSFNLCFSFDEGIVVLDEEQSNVKLLLQIYPRHMCVPVLNQDLDFQRHM